MPALAGSSGSSGCCSRASSSGLGRIAAMRLIRPDFRITREHGIFVQRGKYCMTAVYHPAALLRDASKKEDMLADMERVREKLDALGGA